MSGRNSIHICYRVQYCFAFGVIIAYCFTVSVIMDEDFKAVGLLSCIMYISI